MNSLSLFPFNFESVSPEIIPLRLNQISRQFGSPIPVKESQSRAHSRHRNPLPDCELESRTPTVLGLRNGPDKEFVVQETGEGGAGPFEGFLNFGEEDGADDAAAPPHERDSAVIEMGPFVVVGGLLEEEEALRVGNDLGSIERLQKKEHCVVL